jgi:hypothetical protein
MSALRGLKQQIRNGTALRDSRAKSLCSRLSGSETVLSETNSGGGGAKLLSPLVGTFGSQGLAEVTTKRGQAATFLERRERSEAAKNN